MHDRFISQPHPSPSLSESALMQKLTPEPLLPPLTMQDCSFSHPKPSPSESLDADAQAGNPVADASFDGAVLATIQVCSFSQPYPSPSESESAVEHCGAAVAGLLLSGVSVGVGSGVAGVSGCAGASGCAGVAGVSGCGAGCATGCDGVAFWLQLTVSLPAGWQSKPFTFSLINMN